MIEDLAFLREVPPSTMAWGFVTLSVVYAVFKGVYNLYFHPLRKIPGPKMAALCSWYDFYFDIVRGGEYLWKIEKMHEEYGIESKPILITVWPNTYRRAYCSNQSQRGPHH